MNEEKLLIAAFVAMSVGSYCFGWLVRSRYVSDLRVRIIELEHESAALLKREPRHISKLCPERLPPAWIRWLWRPLLACGLPAPMRWVKPLSHDADSQGLGDGDIACLSGNVWVRRGWYNFGRGDGSGSDALYTWWRRIRANEADMPRWHLGGDSQ